MKKILLSCVLLLVLFFCFSHALADLNGQKTFGLFSYTLKGNGTATITGFDWEKNGTEDIYIPSMIDGYVVNAIGDEAFADDYFNGEVINNYSYGAKREKDPVRIYLPDSITQIGDKAFWESNIKMINIPANVVSIGEGAFGCCFNLDNINVATNSAHFATIDNALYNKIDKELIFWPISYTYNWEPVYINIPNGIRSIGKYVFYVPTEVHEGSHGYHWSSGWPSAVLYLSLPSTLTNIDDYAFFGAKIQKFEYSGASTLSIGNYSFAHSSWNIKNSMERYETSFPKITSCGDYCFAFAQAYRWTIKFDDISVIAPHMFEETNDFIVKIGTPNSIAESAFCKCEVGLYIDISQCLSIAENAFAHGSFDGYYVSSGCFTINTETISKNTFKGANPSSITLGNQVKQIESGAFADCVINEYTIPASVRKIALDAFDIKDDVLFVESGSYAETWAIENGITYKYTGGDNLDWLN